MAEPASPASTVLRPPTLDLAAYRAFLAAKVPPSSRRGFAVEAAEVNPLLKPHVAAGVRWAVAGARRGLFYSFGLGKTGMQLEIGRLVAARLGKPFLIVAPLGVHGEMRADLALFHHGTSERFTPEERAAHAAWTASRTVAPWEGTIRTIRSGAEVTGPGLYLTHYEAVRDGKVKLAAFGGVSLDEASALRGMGGTKTFREFMALSEDMPAEAHRYVATATPSPNDTIELLAYAQFLCIMDIGQAKTRFFKRNSEKADALTLRPHKEREFWLWLASWALMVTRPSDLGFSDAGYDLPDLDVEWIEVPHAVAPTQRGQPGLFAPEAVNDLSQLAKVKRDSLPARIAAAVDVLKRDPTAHALLWHDLEDERRALEKAVPGAVSLYGAQDLETRERAVAAFSAGDIQYLAAKPVLAGSGCNFQRFCALAVFVGIGFKFNDFIQAIHRIHRFLRTKPVRIALIYSQAERGTRRVLEEKWRKHEEQRAVMSDIIREHGLAEASLAAVLERSMGVERVEVSGPNHRLIAGDAVEEAANLAPGSVDMILTSIPFSTQYEYSPNYADFGHSDDDAHFWRQMDFLTPSLVRALGGGRVAAIHVKDRIVPGGINGLGFQTVSTFHCDAIAHYRKHGLALLGMITIATDVVRENNQTYRLAMKEQVKDGSRQGVGVPEYLILFRKPPTDRGDGYADNRVTKSKKWWNAETQAWDHPDGYSLARWQIDAHGFWKSSGDRGLAPDELAGMASAAVYRAWKRHDLSAVYDHEFHVAIGEALTQRLRLPPGFMLLPPHSNHPAVWSDVARMRTSNMVQAAKGAEMHLCPLQWDIVDRAIRRFTNPGETVLDPFGGIMTVPDRAIRLGRKGIGFELNPAYFHDGCIHVAAAESGVATPGLFSVLAAEGEDAAALADAAA